MSNLTFSGTEMLICTSYASGWINSESFGKLAWTLISPLVLDSESLIWSGDAPTPLDVILPLIRTVFWFQDTRLILPFTFVILIDGWVAEVAGSV